MHNELAAHSSMLHVFSSGNNAANLDASVPSALNYPAADSATLPNMLVVGAVGFIKPEAEESISAALGRAGMKTVRGPENGVRLLW